MTPGRDLRGHRLGEAGQDLGEAIGPLLRREDQGGCHQVTGRVVELVGERAERLGRVPPRPDAAHQGGHLRTDHVGCRAQRGHQGALQTDTDRDHAGQVARPLRQAFEAFDRVGLVRDAQDHRQADRRQREDHDGDHPARQQSDHHAGHSRHDPGDQDTARDRSKPHQEPGRRRSGRRDWHATEPRNQPHQATDAEDAHQRGNQRVHATPPWRCASRRNSFAVKP